MNIKKTERGFQRIDFKDRNGVECSLQKSSLATEDAVWFGCNDANPIEFAPGRGWTPIDMPKDYLANTRMHLTQEQVNDLLPYLINFVETGELGSWPAGEVLEVIE